MNPFKAASVPEEAGLSSRALLDYLDALKASGIEQHSVMVVKNNMLAASMHFAPHTAHTPHICYSMSKPFTSIAAGFAVSEGLLALTDRVIDILHDKAPENPDPWLSSVTLHHLLCMGSGLVQKSDQIRHVFGDSGNGEDWAQAVLAFGCDAEPGTTFRYNSHGSYLISCMVQRVAGMNIRDYLMPRLFEPLGIQKPRWDMSPQGICCGGWGLYLSCEDMARFGVCLMQGGAWNGRQIIPEAWLKAATQVHIATDNVPRKPEWAQGYGYHFWRCTGNRFRGDGSEGQYCIVAPDQQMVLAATAKTEDLVGEFDLFNEYIFNEARQTPAPADVQQAFAARVKSLSL
ncbi:MAG: serine hydrolase [Clostridia bacterium]|nr:serine hydrolase [Clostridia bacterium]